MIDVEEVKIADNSVQPGDTDEPLERDALPWLKDPNSRPSIWTILKDMETMRQNLERMRSRTQEAEKHATVLAYLNQDLVKKHDEETQKNIKLRHLVYLKEEEIRYDLDSTFRIVSPC